MTSGNVSDEPIAFRDEEALERLAPIADLFLIHDRPIETRTDDSVVRVVERCRRAPGHADPPLARLCARPSAAPDRPLSAPLLACGAELKNTFCVARGRRAWVGHHIGDLEHFATLTPSPRGSHFEPLFAVAPEVVAHDLHPGYLSTKYALERAGVELVGVQHHHAHLAACLAEHGVHGSGPRRDLRRHRLRHRRDRLGRRAPHRRPVGVRARRPAASGHPSRRLSGHAGAVADGLEWLAEAFGEPQPLPAQLAGSVEPRALGCDRADCRRPGALACDHQHGPAVRCRRGAVRRAGERQLRGPGGDRARGARRDGHQGRRLRDRARRRRRRSGARSPARNPLRLPATPRPQTTSRASQRGSMSRSRGPPPRPARGSHRQLASTRWC